MLDYIKGSVVEINSETITIENNGIGYKIFIPVSLYFKGPKIHDQVMIFIVPIYREDSQRLFGFSTRKDQQTFEKLLLVTGVGPKLALSLIGHLDTKELEVAIAQNDTQSLSKIPGIGKKTAERLVLELRDKIKTFKNIETPIDGTTQDAIQALIHLGYPQKEAYTLIQKALKIDSNLDLANLIKKALQQAAIN
ncbi:MAG: Holliday junction branch migration protein RuvA [Chlamydiae bacterium]|jgi:Holliday junction DNA helicase RuvA|nr:Holliday junction branch migration protein RuvA [Chlamydiota bacterium]